MTMTQYNNNITTTTLSFQTYHFWKWRYSLAHWILYQPDVLACPHVALITQTKRTHWVLLAMIPTNLSFARPPITPIDKYQCWVNLPIPLLPTTKRHSIKMAHKLLTDQLRSLLPQWQQLMFGPIRRIQPTNRILHLGWNLTPISIVSNALVQKMQQSGFVWIIAHDNQKLWKGVGLAPGAAEDIYLGRAEAFGLLAALLFLAHYIKSYGRANFKNALFNCFCDNIGVITQITENINAPWTYPNSAIADDNDIYMVLISTIQQCALANLQFMHIQGHQDTKANWPLTIVEQLNVDCDQQAKTYVLGIEKIQCHLW